MKKLLVVSLALNISMLAALSWKELVAHGASGGPAGNGDVNGDGTIDVGDAVYTLTWLFLGGEAPVKIECAPMPGRLPPTGQLKCYGSGGGTIDCGNALYPGQDAAYRAGCPAGGRFVDNGDGTVTDTCTGLVWQQDTADVDGDGTVGDGDAVTWEDGLRYCEGLTFAGHDDWRLPNVKELFSILDFERPRETIDPIFGLVADDYWSSTSYTIWPTWAYSVSFFNCATVGAPGNSKDLRNHIRAVRGGL